MYAKRQERVYQLLRLLTLEGELYQNKMADLTETSERNVIRQLHLLERNALIEVARKEESSKKGKEKNVWKPTLLGLLTAIRYTTEENEIDEIARANADKWIIFQEWQDLTKDSDVKYMVINQIRSFVETPGLFRQAWTRAFVQDDREWNEFRARIPQILEQQATSFALALNLLFTYGDEVPRVLDPEQPESLAVRLWKTAAANPNLSNFMKQQLKQEETRHKVILEYKKHLALA